MDTNDPLFEALDFGARGFVPHPARLAVELVVLVLFLVVNIGSRAARQYQTEDQED